VTTYQFFGGDMDVATNYQPNTGSLPTAGDTVTTVANAQPGFLDNASLTIGTFNNTDLIAISDSAGLTVTTYNDTGETAISGKGNLTVNGDYTANSVHISDAGSQLVVNGTLTVSNGGTISAQGLYVSNGATETWSKVVLAGSVASPLLVDTSASIEVSTSLTFAGGDLTVTNGGTATIDPDLTMSSGSMIIGVLQTTGPSPAAATLKGNLSLNGNAGVSVHTHGTLTVQGNFSADNGGGASILGGTMVVHGSTGMSIGVNGFGVVSLQLGGQLTVDAGNIDVGVNATSGSVGHLAIDGAGSQVNYNGTIITIGDGGDGRLDVVDGATQTFGELDVGKQATSGTADTPSLVQVSGVGSTLTLNEDLFVGMAGHGEVDVVNGAVLNFSRVNGESISLGLNANSSGTLMVSGAGSQVRAVGNLVINVGDDGTGLLSLQKTAVLYAFNMIVGSGGAGEVDVNASTLNVTNFLKVGSGGLASLIIENGGQVNVTTESIPSLMAIGTNGDTGLVHVNNGTLNAFDLNIGGTEGSGSLEIGQESVVTAAIVEGKTGLIEDSGDLFLRDNSTINGTVVVPTSVVGIVNADSAKGVNITGTGAFQISSGATLQINIFGTENVSIQFEGDEARLEIGGGETINGTLQNLEITDSIRFDGLNVTSAQIIDNGFGTLLQITSTNTGPIDYSVSGDLSGAQFSISHVGSDSIVTLTNLNVPSLNPPPPAGTTSDMFLRDGTGSFEIYNLGNNAILAAYPLGQVGQDWQFVGLGGFNGADTADMILRNSGTGAFEVYDISNNNITGAGSLGAVGLNWQFGGFGDFSSRSGETDMILRNISSGALEVYDIASNRLTSAYSMGAVGLNWAIAGFGDFSGNPNETDMIMRNSNTGALEVYDIANNALTSAYSMGAVGLDWQVAGFGNFSGNVNETDMILRNSNTGALEVYDIANNALTSAYSMGAVGLNWQVGGIAADSSAGTSSQVAQLVQAIAGFGGGAADSSNAAPIADTSEQTLLATPQHA
jgi:T5SS/PEP-CTERM-associated repeat protein